nr:hypothetical protein [Tanacetum cinerariifolium]
GLVAVVLTYLAVLVDAAALGELCLAVLTGTLPEFVITAVKENQEKEKMDKNGKRGEAEKSQKQLQLKEEEKPKKTKKEWPKTHARIKSY